MSAVSSSESLTPVQPTPDSSGGMADQELAQKGAAVSMNHINKKVVKCDHINLIVKFTFYAIVIFFRLMK